VRNIKEAIAYIEDKGWSTVNFGLSRTRHLLAALGSPQSDLRFVHVAGSNGKGSTCAMLEAILRAQGYKTGLYISPYIQKFNERIQVNGVCIPDDRLLEIIERVVAIADAMEDAPTHFEIVTAMGMLYFAEEACDIVVLEVGMGGELDSTNVIGAPEAAVITNIGFEHTQWLGSSLGEIAAAKAGIIKKGCRAVCYDGAPEVTELIKDVCLKREVPLRIADFSELQLLDESLAGQRFIYRDREYNLALLGRHQLFNAALALETVEALREGGRRIDEEAVRRGLMSVKWPARLELLSRDPLFLLDGGHNPQCIEALTQSLLSLVPGQRFSVVAGVLSDKDYANMMDLLMPFAARFFCLTPESPRALDSDELCGYLRGKGAEARSFHFDVEAAIEKARGYAEPILAVGSLYLAGKIRDIVEP